jgi:hypothetical protein
MEETGRPEGGNDPSGLGPSDAANAYAMPWYVPVITFAWLALLLTSVPLYHDISEIRTNLPIQAGPIPLGIVWWGALGGVTVSLVGIAWHWRNWDPQFTWWHILRPVVGAIVGSVSYLIFITVIRSTGTTPKTDSVDSKVVYFLVAFITGYQEQTFRDLLARATQVLLGPGDTTKSKSSSQGEAAQQHQSSVDKLS